MAPAYTASEEWAMQVLSWTWNGNSFTPDVEDLSDVALIATGYSFIGVPDPLYIDMWAEFEIAGWTCDMSHTDA